VALHATDPASVYLAATARLRTPELAAVERALYEERALLRMLGMRRTVFVVPVELAPIVQAACTQAIARLERRRTAQLLRQSGVLEGVEDVDGWLAEVEQATLHVVHVGEPTLPPDALLQTLGLTREQVRGSVIAQTGDAPAARILRLASESHSLFIVMATRTKPGVKTGLGSVASAVVRIAPCPVVLVRPELGVHPAALRRILLPEDGTPTTAAALQPAVELAARSGAELDLLHVAAPAASRPAEPGTLTAPQYIDQPQHEWPVWTREFVERTRRLYDVPARVRTRLFLRTGQPGAEIVRFADEVRGDLVILAWRGRADAERARTMRVVVGGAPCPAMILRVRA
jgi:nucleotide-binding universal stress UspA family protein